MRKKVFTYTTMALPDCMRTLTGTSKLDPVCKTVVRGWVLCIQGIRQVPAPARSVLEQVWDEDFRTFTIKPGAPDDWVAGALWVLEPWEYEVLREVELVDLGWFREETITVETPDGSSVEAAAFVLGDGQETLGEIRQQVAADFLVDREKFLHMLASVREEFMQACGAEAGLNS